MILRLLYIFNENYVINIVLIVFNNQDLFFLIEFSNSFSLMCYTCVIFKLWQLKYSEFGIRKFKFWLIG